MRVIHIVDNAEMINYGVWHAAVSNATQLNKEGVEVELWYPEPGDPENIPVVVKKVKVPSTGIAALKVLIEERKLNKQTDIIISHGAWRYPTQWGHYLKKRGFRWIYVPHGMLEPWSMQQKRIKKLVFFHLLERRMVLKADVVRAVSQTERENLYKFFPRSDVRFMPNAVEPIEKAGKVEDGFVRYLFLSRLHAKKNLLALAKAWVSSPLNNKANTELVFAGPDQGELEGLRQYMQQSNNMRYADSVYGKEKENLIRACTYYILPSFSEGLPSSLLETMSAGLVPIITEGCNLPDVFTLDMGFKIDTSPDDIRAMLAYTVILDKQVIAEKAAKCRSYIDAHFTLQAVTKKQLVFFTQLLSSGSLNVS